MIYLKAFLVAGTICTIGQLILDNTKLTPGHITALFVTCGAFLDIFNLYDKLVIFAGGGAKAIFLKKSLTFKYQAKVICWPTFVALEILDSVYLFWKSLIQLFFKKFIYLFFIFGCVRS